MNIKNICTNLFQLAREPKCSKACLSLGRRRLSRNSHASDFNDSSNHQLWEIFRPSMIISSHLVRFEANKPHHRKMTLAIQRILNRDRLPADSRFPSPTDGLRLTQPKLQGDPADFDESGLPGLLLVLTLIDILRRTASRISAS